MHKVHSSLQKMLEKECKAKIEECKHPTPQVPQFLSESGWRVIRGIGTVAEGCLSSIM